MLALQRGRQIIQRALGVLAEHGLSRAETDFRLVAGLVLIDVADHAFDGGQAIVGLGRGGLRLGRLVAGIDGVLVSFTGLRRSLLNALLGAAVHVLDHLGVRGGQLIELVDAVANRLGLALDIFLAGKRVDLSPKALMAFILQRRFTGGGVAAGGGGL